MKQSQNISSMNVEQETAVIKELRAKFDEEKRRVRQVQSEFRNGRVNDPPSGQTISDLLKLVQKEILEFLYAIEWNQNQLYTLRKNFFDERSKQEERLERYLKRVKQLDADSFMLEIPSKVPEAYQKSLGEFQRRKAFEIAIEKIYN